MEKLARLNAKGQSFDAIGGGGFGGLSQSDIAASLKGLTKIQHELIRAKYCLCDRAVIALYNMVLAEMGNRMGDCYVAKSGYRIGLALSLVTDTVYAGRCPKCKGTAFIDNKECLSCKGTGFKNLSERKIAMSCGMDHKNFRLYRDVYRRQYEHLRAIELSAISKVRANLAQESDDKELVIVK